jgi:2-polyprenyl-6-methoxyphenol hydroxylase-like FAD-dependent oxidoreductase
MVTGGSLVGLSVAIAPSGFGIDVTVLERSPFRAEAGGGGLGVDVSLLRRVTGIDDEPPVVHGTDRDTTAWHLPQGWLEDNALRRSGITVHRGTQVTGVQPGDDEQPARVMTAEGGEYRADLVIGADGVRSTVRASVAPDEPDALYAGVLLWRTLVDERALPHGAARLPSGEPSREIYAGPYRLVTYLVPGAAGETGGGNRRLNMVWYDPDRSELLRSRACSTVRRSRAAWHPGTCRTPCASGSPRSRRRTGPAPGARRWPKPWLAVPCSAPRSCTTSRGG